MTTQNRPLSPHLQVYRPQLTSMLSITHRLTGVALAIGTFLLRVSVMREEGGGSTRTRNSKTNSSLNFNHGMTHLKD